MRYIPIDLSSDNHLQQPQIFAGYAGEHNETVLKVKLPNRMIGIECSGYRFDFQTAEGNEILSPLIPVSELHNSVLSFYLVEQLTIAGKLFFNVTAVLSDENTISLISKTNKVTLQIGDSPEGNAILPDPNGYKDELLKMIDERLLEIDPVGQETPEGGEIFNDYENNKAIGYMSHVGGCYSKTTVDGEISFVHGYGVQADERAQAVFGLLNKDDENALFIVGNGKGTINTDDGTDNADVARSNAFVVRKDGTGLLGDEQIATQNYVNSQVASLASISITRTIVNELPQSSEAKENVIYMIPADSGAENNIYNEYMFFDNSGVLTPELIGNTAVDWVGTPAKSLVFDTQANLNSWLGNITRKNLFNPVPDEGDTIEDDIYEECRINSDGSIHLPSIWNEDGHNTPIYHYNFTLPAGTYTASIKGYTPDNYLNVNFKINGVECNLSETSDEDYEYKNATFELSETSTIYLELSAGGGASDVTAWVQIEEGTEATEYETYILLYVREDGLTKSDINVGDMLLVEEEDSPDYYWNGRKNVAIKAQTLDMSNYYTKDEVTALINEAIGAALEGDY